LLGLSIDDPTFSEPRLSVGFGVRIQIPYLQLPISLDLGWPLIYEETDDRRVLYFSISP
jgi:outer membrane protein assembly factor BamA